MKQFYLILIILFTTASLFSQESGGADKGKEPHDEIEKLDQGSNLEKKQYKDISESLRERIVSGLKLLTIVTANFGEDVPDSKNTLEKLRKDYQVALRYYYRRAYILSGKGMGQVDKDLSEILSKFAKSFDAKTQTLLTECADAISQQEQSQLVDDSKESGKQSTNVYVDITSSQQKLKIAYYQLALATDMVEGKRYYHSIVHYRIAKDYGIKILTDLKGTEADKKTIQDKYAKDLSDNRNLIFGAGSSTPSN
ncbi:hypothetical protein [Leptospira sp. 'Mane']|uniref:hypothetical protein n=1 Tax=Leptospira sp. 'Mane' TaxID=3387407 RepID=UPI00398A61B1